MVSPVELVKHWHCPSCHLEHQSQGRETAMHHCPKLNGLLVPLVLDGADATHRVLLREDYQGTDLCSARDEDGRIVMSVSTEYADGSNALTVYMPCATADAEAVRGYVGARTPGTAVASAEAG
jgi:hypothetical protein